MKKILVVEDVLGTQKFVFSELEQSGYSVLAASDLVEALEMISMQNFDLFILDDMMPRVSGYEGIRAIQSRERIQKVPIVMMSRGLDLDEVTRVRTLGVNILNKPLKQNELREAVSYLTKEVGH